MKILGLDHVVVRVRDLDASLRFYCEALGCSEERRSDELGLVQLRAGTALIDLVPLDSPLGRAGGAAPDAKAPNIDHFALRIGDFDGPALIAHLRSHDIECSEIAERYGAEGSGPSIYIRDPDGNGVELKAAISAPGSST